MQIKRHCVLIGQLHSLREYVISQQFIEEYIAIRTGFW